LPKIINPFYNGKREFNPQREGNIKNVKWKGKPQEPKVVFKVKTSTAGQTYPTSFPKG